MKNSVVFSFLLFFFGACLVACVLGCGAPEGQSTADAGTDSAASPIGEGGENPDAPVKVSATSAPVTSPVLRRTNLATERLKARASEQVQMINPGGPDAWEGEVLNDMADRELHKLSDAVSLGKVERLKDLRMLASSDFSCGPLRPQRLMPVWDRQGMKVYREGSAGTAAPLAAPAYTGQDGFVKAIEELLTPLMEGEREREGAGAYVKFKIFRVTPAGSVLEAGSVFDTRLYYESGARTRQGSLTQHATWRTRWRISEKSGLPQLVRIEAADYEEVVGAFPQKTLYVDVTEAALGRNASFQKQLLRGLNYWTAQIDRSYAPNLAARCGLAVGDVNGDGLEDVYLCQPVGLPNHLLLQQPDGTFLDTAVEAGVDFLDHTASALLLDLDNDGDQDLVVAVPYRVVFLENDGKGRFGKAFEAKIPEWDVNSICAVDYNLDRRLDVFVCIDSGKATTEGFVFHNARNGGQKFMFRNEISATPAGGWRFTDVAKEVGLASDRRALAAAWEDYDNDGDQDLYVANDFGPNHLFRNDGGKFVEVAVEAGVEDFGSGMSVSWADFNRDGKMDLYVGNMFSSAGNRITHETKPPEAVKKSGNKEVVTALRRFAKGNSLFENVGQGRFREVGDQRGVELGRWAWASPFVDVNNDGWDDIVVSNGFVTSDDPDDL
jgi:hypothetical protein